ncbi:MAG: DUF2132 domain-containing protein [Planctomycetes bacterium]|nr:DUF2132 domain-containing protein [Planctomycetota bacterium]
MESHQRNNPLHGVTLETIVTELSKRVGWRVMADRIPIRCFMFDPTVTSSLRFLRKTPWARTKVEALFLELRESEGPPAAK